jgi:hypothetical protein
MAGMFGYAALSRFLAPAAAILCVLAGIAAARAVTVIGGIGLLLVVAADRAWLEEDLDRAVALAGGTLCSPAARSPSAPRT